LGELLTGVLEGTPLTLWYAAALLIPLVGTLAATPYMGKLAHRLDILNPPQEARFHSKSTPYLGGLAVAAGLVLVGAIAASSSGELLVLLLGGLAMMIVGFEDDRRDIGPLLKVLVEIAAAVALWLVGVRVTLFDVATLDLMLTVIWIIAITNAVNLIDNMDGLASGTAAIAATTFAVIAGFRGDVLVAGLALAVAGASLGFLRHNFPPARIFLGDAGSLLLGFLLAALALKLDLVGTTGWVHAAVPVLILGMPIFDTVLVVIARVSEGRKVYVGGTDHSSHRLVLAGLDGKEVAFATYALELVLAVCALYVLSADAHGALVVVIGAGVVAIIGLIVLLRIHPIGEIDTRESAKA